MGDRIGRNTPCPCGSGKKYKLCCLGKFDDPAYSDIGSLAYLYKEARKGARFKECIHPDQSACSGKIIGAHSIQNNKILAKIADNGKVFMPCPKPDLSFSIQNEYGRKEASVFSGFCEHHDKTVFQPIEDRSFIGTDEQTFLHVYRAFALEYHRKKEVVRMEQKIFARKPSLANMPGRAIGGKTAFDMAVSDFEEEKILFDRALLNSRYDVLTSFIWTFPGFSNFAATGCEAPMTDFFGKKIQDLFDSNTPARHIYLCVFPEEDKTFAIVAWLSKYDDLFSSIGFKLNSLTEEEKKNYVNNTIPIITENIAIRPSSWEALPQQAKDEYGMLFYGIADIMELNGEKLNRFDKPTFDLFSI